MKTEWTVQSRRIAPPAFILIFSVLIGLLISWFIPTKLFPDQYVIPVGLTLFILAGPVAFLTFRSYSRNNSTFLFTETSKVLVSDGPNSFTRNPGYISLIMLFTSLSVFANSMWAFGMIIPASLIIHYGIVKREEKYLEELFGDEYLKYKSSVPRWF